MDRFGRQVFSTGARENVQLAGAGGKQLQQAGQRIKGGMEYIEVDREKKEIADAADFVSDMGSQLTLEDNENFLTMQQERASNPELASSEYLKGMDERYDEAIQSAPNDQAREFLQKKKETARTRYGVRGQTWEHNQGIQNQITRLNDNTNSLINQALSVNDEGDVAPLIEQHMANMTLASSHMDGEQVKAAQKGGTARIYNAFLSNRIDTNPQSVIDSLDGGQYDEILQPQQKKSLLNSALSARSRELKAQVEKKEAIEKTSRVQDKLDGKSQEIFNPNKKQDREAVQQHWDAMNGSDGLLQLKPESIKQLGLYAKNMGILPESSVSNITGMLSNGTLEQRNFAVDAIAILEERKPEVLNQFKKRDIEKAKMAADMMRGGAGGANSAKTIWEQVDEHYAPTNKDIIELRKKDLNEIKKSSNIYNKDKLSDMITEQFDNWLPFNEPDMPPDMRNIKNMSERMRIGIIKDFEKIYERTGIEDVAEEEAMRNFTTNHGVHNGIVMKHAPIKYVGVEGVDNEKWMREQLVDKTFERFKKQGVEMERVFGGSSKIKERMQKVGFADNIILIPDEITDREAKPGGNPSYQVVYMDGGIPIPLMNDDKTKPMRFSYDNTEVIKKANEEKKQEDREKTAEKEKKREIKDLQKKFNEEHKRAGLGTVITAGGK